MKKTLFAMVAIAACVFCNKVNAQDKAVVTLQHGESMTAFYGSNAFKDAVEAAEAGDLLTLSGNSFAATTITKPLLIQGAGYVEDPQNFRHRTTITGNMNIQIPEGAAGLLLEGIYFNDYVYIIGDGLNDFIIRKCQFVNDLSLNAVNSGGFIDQCKFNWYLGFNASTTDFFMTNSIVQYLSGNYGSKSITIDHCVILQQLGLLANYYNSLFAYISSNNSSSNYHNNVICTCSASSSIQNNIILSSQDYYALFISNSNYHLTEEAATTYLGSDGTQVGIYGGETPFTDVPTNPQITSKNISTRSNANGKISVQLTVEAQQ
jgi:hypothetical protein